MSTVVFKRLRVVSPEAVEDAIAQIMSRLELTDELLGETCLLKINTMSDELYPGRNTSPWVLDGVLSVLRDIFPHCRFLIVDCDTAGSRQFAGACRVWGYNQIAERHGVAIRNLSREPTVAIATGNAVCPTLEFPRLVMEASSIINLPVLKTHILTGITCALKNHWGLLPRLRYQYHPHVNEVIAEINRQVRHTICTLVDATVYIKGSGPKTGVPRIVNALLGSRDRVAVDAAALRFIGMDPGRAPHVQRAAELGVGTMDCTIEGDELVPERFAMPAQSGDLVSAAEKLLRGIPLLGPIVYRPCIARALGTIGFRYNRHIWLPLRGRKHVRRLLAHPDYGREFGGSFTEGQAAAG